MNTRTTASRGALALCCLLLPTALACAPDESSPAHDAGAADSARGPHGGRWLADGEFALELVLFEAGVAPEYRAFVYRDGEPLVPPAGVELEAVLHRLDGRSERIGFALRGDQLAATTPVGEPHSFDVELLAREGGREHRFAFSSYENRVTLAPEQVAAAGITVARAGPATIGERVVLNGRIAPNEDAFTHVMPRYPGVVRSVHKRLGDAVARGDLLVVIESNESLQPYELRALLAGHVIAKDVAPGEFVSSERELFQIADLGTVWVELDVYRRDCARLRAGQPVFVDAGDGSPAAQTTLAYLSPVGAASTQTLLARAVLPNPELRWRPGLFVTAEVELRAAPVPVAVAREALQRIGGREVVFLAVGDTFEALPVELGLEDAAQVEVVSGLAAGQDYVATGSFVLKAEAGRAGASHDH